MPELHKQPLYTWEGAQGFLRHWYVCGFFPANVIHGEDPNLMDAKNSEHWETDHLGAWGGEAAITDAPQQEGDAGINWLPVQADAFKQKLLMGELRQNYPEIDTAAQDVNLGDAQWYALALLDSDAERTVTLKFSVHDSTRLFFNGALIFDEHKWHHVIYDEVSVELSLNQGRNSLLFKNERDGLVARIVDDNGKAPEGLVQLAGDDAPRRVDNAAHAMRLHALTLEINNPFTGSSQEDLSTWQNEFRPIYERGMGVRVPLSSNAVKEVQQVACDGYTRFEIKVPCEGDEYFDASILIPDDNRRNGKTIITPHGHRFWYKHVIGVDPEPQPRWSQMGPEDANYNEQLAQAGFVTAAFAQRGFDNRNDVGDGHACNQLARMAESMGYTLPGFYHADITCLADHVATIDGVDGDNLGLGGLSGGASISWIIGAYDERFKAVATFCGLARARSWAYSGACGMQIVPDVFPSGDSGEMLSLIAPRALLIGQGRYDASFSILESKSIYEDARKAWVAAGVEDKIQFEVIDSGHQFHVPTAAAFFEKNL